MSEQTASASVALEQDGNCIECNIVIYKRVYSFLYYSKFSIISTPNTQPLRKVYAGQLSGQPTANNQKEANQSFA